MSVAFARNSARYNNGTHYKLKFHVQLIKPTFLLYRAPVL